MIYDTGLNPVIPSYHADFAYGCHSEPVVIHRLSKYFNEPIEKTKDRYCPYDAFSTQQNMKLNHVDANQPSLQQLLYLSIK